MYSRCHLATGQSGRRSRKRRLHAARNVRGPTSFPAPVPAGGPFQRRVGRWPLPVVRQPATRISGRLTCCEVSSPPGVPKDEVLPPAGHADRIRSGQAIGANRFDRPAGARAPAGLQVLKLAGLAVRGAPLQRPKAVHLGPAHAGNRRALVIDGPPGAPASLDGPAWLLARASPYGSGRKTAPSGGQPCSS